VGPSVSHDAVTQTRSTGSRMPVLQVVASNYSDSALWIDIEVKYDKDVY
jgi:hypothetical protein